MSDVGSKIVRPVLKRADSVKQIGNQVLESKFTVFAADKLDGALSVADMYVDKYLPADVFDKGNEGVDVVDAPPSGSGNAGKALHTGQHMFRFSKKLRRRLTQRTLLEAKALKEQSAEAIHVLVYVAELVRPGYQVCDNQMFNIIWCFIRLLLIQNWLYKRVGNYG